MLFTCIIISDVFTPCVFVLMLWQHRCIFFVMPIKQIEIEKMRERQKERERDRERQRERDRQRE